jgi:kynurenine formamidase
VTARDELPDFAELPIDPLCPPGSAWGVFGDDDQVGTLNFQTPERTLRAISEVRRGECFPLNWDVESPSPALFGRSVLQHRILDLDPVGTEDVYDGFFPQGSSQWDALAHIKHPAHGFYNGVSRGDITGRAGSRNGIDAWATRGIAGRFVLADLASWARATDQAFDPGESNAIDVEQIEACLEHQGTTMEPGDVLLLRFGWIEWYEAASMAVREQIASTDLFSATGLANEERTAEWLWDHRVAAVGADNPALEAMPFDESSASGYLHYRLIPLLGLAIAELLYLGPLARACAEDGLYTGLLTAAPINKVGGSGSPANAIALR